METFAPTSFLMALSKYVIMNVLRIDKTVAMVFTVSLNLSSALT